MIVSSPRDDELAPVISTPNGRCLKVFQAFDRWRRRGCKYSQARRQAKRIAS
jgi:hypothetical protein